MSIGSKGNTVETPMVTPNLVSGTAKIGPSLSNNHSEQTLHMGYSKNYSDNAGININSKSQKRYSSVCDDPSVMKDVDELLARIATLEH